MPTDATAKITIINRRLNPVDFQRTMLMPECSDGLDYYRGEYNQIILDKAAESNNLVQEKYITLSIGLRKIEQTRAYFRRVDTNLSASFGRLDSGAYAISCADRLRLLHDFFRPGEEASFRFDLSANIKHGIDFRDLICPDGLQFRAGYFEMGCKFGRVLFMRDYASFISDEMIKDLSDFSRNLLLSIDILPIPTEEAVREVQSRILGVETDITRWQQRQNRQNNFTATVPYDLEQMRTESKDLLEDLTARDQRLMFACVTLVHIADSLEQLDADTQTLQSIAQEKLCGFSVLRYQQEDGLNTVLPYGLRRIHALRTLTTESCAVLMPFRAQEIQDPGGLYYGVNAISKNLLICDRKRLISPHAFYLGVSGSGKSVAMKNTIANVALSTEDDIIIIDAEREYAPIARALGGEVIEISPNSQRHINPLDLQDGYTDRMQFRIIAESSKNGRIPLDYAARCIEGLKELVLYAACAEEKACPICVRTFNNAKVNLDKFQFEQTEIGSFIFNVGVQVADEDNEQLFLPEVNPQPYEPPEHRIVKRIEKAILQIDDVAERRITMSNLVENAYEEGITANMCDAISMLKPEDGDIELETSIHYAEAITRAVIPPTVRKFDNIHFALVDDISRRYKDCTLIEDVTLRGMINMLSKSASAVEEGENTVRLFTKIDGKSRAVTLHLSPENHTLACDAYRDDKEVEVSGVIDKSGKYWFFSQVNSFRVIE